MDIDVNIDYNISIEENIQKNIALIKTTFIDYLYKKFDSFESIEMEFIFVSSQEMIDYNIEYLNHNYDTDILTFDLSTSKSRIQASCILSFHKIYENSVEYSTSLKEEIARVMIHGFLHLVGFDDKTIILKNIMIEEENKFIKYLNS